MITLGYYIFLVFSSIMEGLFWDKYKGRNPKGLNWRNVHIYLTMMRGGVGLIMLPSVGWDVAFHAFSFMLFHDGIYYMTRNKLNPEVYPKGFFDFSTTSTAYGTLKFHWRLLAAIFGLIFLLI